MTLREGRRERALTIVQWVGAAILIVCFESHMISRPTVFLFGPLALWAVMMAVEVPEIRRKRWRVSLAVISTCSVGFYLFFRFVDK